MGIVLSNAYKNDNVYNMILPRRSTPYKFFEELAKDNFSVYKRSHRIVTRIPGSGRKASSNLSEIYLGDKWKIAKIEETLFSAVLLSELFFSEFMRKGALPHGSTKITGNLVKLGVLSNTKFGLFIPALLRSVAEKKMTLKGDKQGEIMRDVQNKEIAMLSRLLKACDRVALILPEYMCNDVRWKIKGENFWKPVHVGKESYTDID